MTAPLVTACNCCNRHIDGKYYCDDCRHEHGSRLAPHDPETWEPMCSFWRAESRAYAARLAALPVHPIVRLGKAIASKLNEYEPRWSWRGNH